MGEGRRTCRVGRFSKGPGVGGEADRITSSRPNYMVLRSGSNAIGGMTRWIFKFVDLNVYTGWTLLYIPSTF